MRRFTKLCTVSHTCTMFTVPSTVDTQVIFSYLFSPPKSLNSSIQTTKFLEKTRSSDSEDVLSYFRNFGRATCVAHWRNIAVNMSTLTAVFVEFGYVCWFILAAISFTVSQIKYDRWPSPPNYNCKSCSSFSITKIKDFEPRTSDWLI